MQCKLLKAVKSVQPLSSLISNQPCTTLVQGHRRAHTPGNGTTQLERQIWRFHSTRSWQWRFRAAGD